MKTFMLFFSAMATMTLVAAREKPVVFVDSFIPAEGCKATAGDIQILRSRIVGNVTSSRKYDVVERDRLAEVQKELKYVDSGMTEGDGPESNKLKAAGYCVYGNVLQYRNYSRVAQVGELSVKNVFGTVEVQIRITNIANGRILMVKTVKSEKSKTLSNAVPSNVNLEQEVMVEAVAEAARLVVERLNNVAFPVYVLSANSRFVTGNITEDLVSVGDVWEVFVLGDELNDPQTGEALGFDEELIAAVRVSRPGPKTTKFEYGADDATAEKAKKDILSGKEDGERMIMRRLQTVETKVPPRSAPPRLRGLR